PGVVGEFMKYLPATVIICLSASLLMALIFLPTMGGASTQTPPKQPASRSKLAQGYRKTLSLLLAHPGLTLLTTMVFIVLVYVGYARFNHGVEFFPGIEPESFQLHIRARGDLSIHEKDKVLQRIEQ